tara:strand:- start:718 stop:1443 length:726 start_codon:yes stop_codon:yes gene_type:complete
MTKRQIPQHLKDLIDKVGMTEQEATWDCHGSTIIKHEALERIADYVGITFEVPTTIESNLEKGIFCVHYVGTDGDKMSESYGEATPQNNKNLYASAMAEKRAKDRVILKLIGVSGHVYSSEEADWKEIKKQKDEEKRRKEEQKQQVKQEEPPPFEPDTKPVSILQQDLTDDQMRDLSRDEYLMVQIPTQISKFIDAQDANTWLNKNSKLLETIKQNYSADYKIISTLFNKKLDDLEGVNNG